MNKTDKKQTWGRWDNMHHSLEGFFRGILLHSELAWEVSPSSHPGLSSVIWRTMNTTSFIGSTGIILCSHWACRAAGESGAPGSFLALPCPHHLLCAAYLVLGPLQLPGPTAPVLLLPHCGHHSLVVMDQFKRPHKTPSRDNCATGRTAYGHRCLSFIRVLWTGKNDRFRKVSCGACVLLWKKHFPNLLLYPCTLDIISCPLPHPLMPIMPLKEEQRGWEWWLMGVPAHLCMSGGESTLGNSASVLDKSTEMEAKIMKYTTLHNKVWINITSARKTFTLIIY